VVFAPRVYFAYLFQLSTRDRDGTASWPLSASTRGKYGNDDRFAQGRVYAWDGGVGQRFRITIW